MTAAEEWRPVVGYEEWYEVSSRGRLKRIKPGRGTIAGAILNPGIGRRGYRHVTIPSEQRRRLLYVHSIVAAAFIGPRPSGCDVNHIDGDKTNNQACNLEYVTRKRNIDHAVELGLFPVGEDYGRSHLTNDDVRTIRDLAATMRVTAIARQFIVSHRTISDILLGKTWKHVA